MEKYGKARQYTQGLLVSQRRNIEQISDTMAGLDYFQLQHFITESNWDADEVINKVAMEVSTVLPKRKLTGLIIDESGWVKKGDLTMRIEAPRSKLRGIFDPQQEIC